MTQDELEVFLLVGAGLFITIFSGVLVYNFTHNIWISIGASMAVISLHIIILKFVRKPL